MAPYTPRLSAARDTFYGMNSPEIAELPQAQADSPLPEREPTGNAAVDAALQLLGELAERPTEQHPELYDEVHQRLQAALADLGR
jgi:hypothetical protein